MNIYIFTVYVYIYVCMYVYMIIYSLTAVSLQDYFIWSQLGKARLLAHIFLLLSFFLYSCLNIIDSISQVC